MAFTAEKAYELMESAHQRGRLAHAFLITGKPGSGKEALAARVIQMLNPPLDAGAGANLFGEEEPVEAPELDELNGALVRIVRPRSKSRRITVDDIRALEKSFYVAAAPDQWKVGVIVNADRLNESSENAFLKTLEEPPNNCALMLLTDSPNQLLPTILSRCVCISLMDGAGAGVPNEMQAEFLAALASFSRAGVGEIANALNLRGVFTGVLARKKSEVTKLNDLALKEETLKYKNATDGEWLKTREDFYKAQTEVEYLEHRDDLLEVLLTWMGDALRQKAEVGNLELPTESAHTQTMADACTMSDLLQRMDALEQLKANLQTNAQEQLALEVGFMQAFA